MLPSIQDGSRGAAHRERDPRVLAAEPRAVAHQVWCVPAPGAGWLACRAASAPVPVPRAARCSRAAKFELLCGGGCGAGRLAGSTRSGPALRRRRRWPCCHTQLRPATRHLGPCPGLADATCRPPRAAGLRYEDILTEKPTVDTATQRLPGDAAEARKRRIKRAIDLSLKRKQMPEAKQAYDPLQPYMNDLVEEAEREDADEREFAH